MAQFVPLCMTPDEHASWQAAHAQVVRLTSRGGSRGRLATPCVDCPIDFAQEMRLQLKCNGSPRIRATARNSPRRLLQWREYQARKRNGVRLARRPEEVVAVRQRILSLYADGLPTREVARLTGVPDSYARHTRAEARAA